MEFLFLFVRRVGLTNHLDKQRDPFVTKAHMFRVFVVQISEICRLTQTILEQDDNIGGNGSLKRNDLKVGILSELVWPRPSLSKNHCFSCSLNGHIFFIKKTHLFW